MSKMCHLMCLVAQKDINNTNVHEMQYYKYHSNYLLIICLNDLPPLLNLLPPSAVKMWICNCHRKKVEVLHLHPLIFPQSPKLSLRNVPSPLWEMKAACKPYSKRGRQRTENPGVYGKEGRMIENLMPWHQFPQIFK